MEKANQLCLSDEELLSEIKYYIENKFYNYAVMIDGTIPVYIRTFTVRAQMSESILPID